MKNTSQNPKAPRRKPSDPLVGRFFHSFENRKNADGREKREIGWQGLVVASPLPGYYLVQLFEWLAGEPNGQRLMKIDDMLDWQFYDSAEEMNDFWERTSARDYE